MLDALKSDVDVLFYNVFGLIEIGENQVTVTANSVRSGKAQSRTVTSELNNPLKNFTLPFALSFGAWLDKGDVHLAFGKMDEYNEAVFNANILMIEKMVKETVDLMKSIFK